MAVVEVSPIEATELAAQGALLLDVRNDDEWAAGHAPHAQFVTLSELAARASELPADRTIVAVCRSGARSGRATEFLTAQGIDTVNLAGGMKAWAAAGLDVVTDAGTPGEVI